MRWQFSTADGVDAAAAFYDQHGFVGLTDLLGDDDLRRLNAAFDETVQARKYTVGVEEMSSGNDALFMHPVFETYAKDDRFIGLARRLFRGRSVELQHSKINAKPTADRGKGVIPWHQDFPFFPHTNYDLLALAVHLDDEDVDSGPMRLIPGSHEWGVLSHCKEDGDFAYECTEPIDFTDRPSVFLTGSAGLVAVHHCLTLHTSAMKVTDRPRRHVVFQYRAQDAVQLAGVVWRCTGYAVTEPGAEKGRARFPDGTSVELRGVEGRLYDGGGQLAPDK